MLKLKKLDHVSLVVQDVERSAAWYRDILGMDIVRMKNSPVFAALQGSLLVGLFAAEGGIYEPASHGGLSLKNTLIRRHFAFNTSKENFIQAQKLLKAKGIPFEYLFHPPTESIYLEDPDKNLVEITNYL